MRNKNPMTYLGLALITVLLCAPFPAEGAVVVRQRMADGVFASIRDGQFIFLECRPQEGDPQSIVSPHLLDPNQWTRYKGLQSAAIPFQQLNGRSQRSLLETLFPSDYADEKGWWHTVMFSGEQGDETWHAVADWFTGSSRNVTRLIHAPENAGASSRLVRGQKVFIPKMLLLPELQAPSTRQPAPPPTPQVEAIAQQRATPMPGVNGAKANTVVLPGRRAYVGPAPAQQATPKTAPAPAAPTPVPPQPEALPAEEPKLAAAPAPEPQEPVQMAEADTPRRTITPRGAGKGRSSRKENSPPKEPDSIERMDATPVEDVTNAFQAPPLVLPESRPPAGARVPPPPPPAGDLIYGNDAKGPYAAYRLQRGEAIYTAVVARFTDFQTSDDINEACRIVLERSGISDPTRIDAGQSIRIPMDILSDQYWPAGTTQRKGFEVIAQEAQRLQGQRVQSKDLDGVVVVIDPGHGGADQGASHSASGLYEDELNYDIACRLKQRLETSTRAKVYFTLTDPKQGYEPRNNTRFVSDRNEELLTTPRYWNADAKVSANLRWYLANSVYEREVNKGLDPRKAVFMSIHCDALHEKMRGTMIYVPGAQYRRDREQPGGAVYANYEETNNHAAVLTTGADRVRDEALSRNFAQTIIKTLQNHGTPIAVGKHGDPIRNVIRQGRGVAYVPAVLRNNQIPTKVLIETANLNNATDRERLADPGWRQAYADALLMALLEHYRN